MLWVVQAQGALLHRERPSPMSVHAVHQDTILLPTIGRPAAVGVYVAKTHRHPSRWAGHTAALAGWGAIIAALAALAVGPIVGIMIAAGAWATAVVFGAASLAALTMAMVAAAARTAAVVRRAVAESEQRIVDRLEQTIKQETRRQAEVTRAGLQQRVAELERQVADASTAEAVIRRATGGQVLHLHPRRAG